MRSVTTFISVLMAVLLLAALAMGVRAQGGVSVPPSTIPETGTGGELQALIEGLLYEGFDYGPITTSVAPPEGLPATGASGGGELETLVEGLLYGRFDYGPITTNTAPPEALPATGASGGGELEALVEGLLYDGFDGSLVPATPAPREGSPAGLHEQAAQCVNGFITNGSLVYVCDDPGALYGN